MKNFLPRRRWLRFSLSTCFILVTLVAVWLGVQMKWIKDRHQATKPQSATNFGGRLASTGHDIAYYAGSGTPAPWSLRIFGEQGCYSVAVVPENEDAPTVNDKQALRQVRLLFPEAKVKYVKTMVGGFF